MQDELDAEDLPVKVRILGVNPQGEESGNDRMKELGDLPWLQDVPTQKAWRRWRVTKRDVVVLDRHGAKHAVYNLSEHDLSDAKHYGELKELIRAAARVP